MRARLTKRRDERVKGTSRAILMNLLKVILLNPTGIIVTRSDQTKIVQKSLSYGTTMTLTMILFYLGGIQICVDYRSVMSASQKLVGPPSPTAPLSSPSSLPLRETLMEELFGPPSPSPSAPPSPSPSAPSPVPLRMVVNNVKTNHQLVFKQEEVSIKDICDEVKKFRLRLYGNQKFQEPVIKISKFGVIKSPKDETLISLKEEQIECILNSPKAKKSQKEIDEIKKRNKRIYERKFNSCPIYKQKKFMEAQIKEKNMRK